MVVILELPVFLSSDHPPGDDASEYRSSHMMYLMDRCVHMHSPKQKPV
jgi:hypothetical protein